MARIIVVLAVLAIFSAVLIHQLHQRLYGIPVPEGFNPNSTFSLRVVGFVLSLGRDLCSFSHRWYLTDSRQICTRYMFGLLATASRMNSFSDQLEVNDTEIFGTGVRIYRPLNGTKHDDDENNGEINLLPAVIYYHGGGWTVGSLDAYDAFCRRLAVTAHVIVISADYRQAPEHLYPIAFHDSYNVAVGLLNNGTQYGVDVKKVFVAGDSAGGNLAAAVAHYLAEVGEKHCRRQYLVGQVLIYPSLQMLSLSLPSHFENEHAVVLSRRQTAAYISMYLSGSLDLVDAMLEGNHSKHLENTTFMSYIKLSSDDNSNIDDQSAEKASEVIPKPFVEMSESAAEALTDFKGSPLVAKNFRGIPPTFVLTAKYDPIRDDGFLYAKRLRNAGVEVVHNNYNSFHGFLTVTSEPWPYGTQEAAEALNDIVNYINSKIEDIADGKIHENEDREI